MPRLLRGAGKLERSAAIWRAGGPVARKHRLVYRVAGKGKAQALEVAQCWYCNRANSAERRGSIVKQGRSSAKGYRNPDGLRASAMRRDRTNGADITPARALPYDRVEHRTGCGSVKTAMKTNCLPFGKGRHAVRHESRALII